DLSALCAVLAKEYEWAKKLNSQARQASAERAWQSIKRFYDNCKSPSIKKKGYPKFKKSRSVEYKTTGWKLSEERKKAINKLGRKHLKVSRQRKDFAVKLARCVVKSNDLVVFEDLQVRNLVKNHRLAKSISDAAWRQFFKWLEYYGQVFGKIVISVPPQYTSQDCSACHQSACHQIVKKSLSQRTHIGSCGLVLDRDENAARNLLAKGLELVSRGGHSRINAQGHLNLCQVSESLLDKFGG
ncbi:transposase, partial [Geitlerinema sp. P-1104]|uniref:RNA-guided endonuclease InsQ/TnpB family protein n=1 Tax=Geitlerinema sp. P-1104 TaxID=2546230 RepID=UPI001476CE9C